MKKLSLDESAPSRTFGINDRNLKALEQLLQVRIFARGTEVRIQGEEADAELARRALEELAELAREGTAIKANDVEAVVRVLRDDPDLSLKEYFRRMAVRPSARKPVLPRTRNQAEYLETIRKKDIVFATGPAGTGKTYLAVAMALEAHKKDLISRIILTRPAVEAGEKLGFLPGDISDKVDPYLRPLNDALFDLEYREKAQRMIDEGTVEIAPLAFMRGRTLADAFAILDEAQNTTPEQMKMFLTRLGPNSRAVITGDVTQIDLPTSRRSGLVEAIEILSRIGEIGFITFTEEDIIRHHLVQKIVRAYETHGKAKGQPAPPQD